MNYTSIIIFLVLMAATWLGAYIAGRSGYMKYEKELLEEAREKEKAASKERKRWQDVPVTITVTHDPAIAEMSRNVNYPTFRDLEIARLDGALIASTERLQRMYEYLAEDPDSTLIKNEISWIEDAIRSTQEELKNVIEN